MTYNGLHIERGVEDPKTRTLHKKAFLPIVIMILLWANVLYQSIPMVWVSLPRTFPTAN